MKTFHFRSSQFLPAPLEEVFAFFADPENLEAITPPWLEFRMVTPAPIEMKPGALIDYRLKIRGIPIGWRTEITEWDPSGRFVDTQLRGPYTSWVHTHTFSAQSGGTRVEDDVDYRVPGGSLVERLIVRPDVEEIFRHRTMTLGEIFGAPSSTPDG